VISVKQDSRSEDDWLFAENNTAVLFVVSNDGADGIWRIVHFNHAFAEIFDVPPGNDDGGTNHCLPLGFAARLARALYRCARSGRTIGFNACLSKRPNNHHWEFLLEPAHGFGPRRRHILVQGRDVTAQRQTVRDLKLVTEKLLGAQEDECRRIARDLHDSTAQHLVALGLGITHLEILARQRDGLNSYAGRLVADMRATLSRAHDEIRTLSLLLHPPEPDGSEIGRYRDRPDSNCTRSSGECLPAVSVLTPREREIVQLIAEGGSNRKIAKALGISVKTVETHRSASMRKLKVHSTAELVRYAMRSKIIQP
jgi:DNA-binding CsgD family transcriptional regulator/signal transduction histidine kinase